MKAIILITESIAIVTNRVISGVSHSECYNKLSSILKKAIGFQYDNQKRLEDNIIGFYTQQGYPQFETLCQEFEELISGWKRERRDLSLIDLSMNVKLMASSAKVPGNLEVEVEEKEESKQTEKKQEEKPAPTPVCDAPTPTPAPAIAPKTVNWLGDDAFCSKCGRKLRVRKLDKTGYSLEAEDCFC